MKTKMKTKIGICICLFALAFTNFTSAQDDLKPLRIGLKFGIPTLAGLNVEYLTPKLNNRLAADLDLSYINYSIGSIQMNYIYSGLGANYYFFKPGKGLYGGLGYGLIRNAATATISVVQEGIFLESIGKASNFHHNLNMKIGGKHGDRIYFRWELGYALNFISSDLVASGDANANIAGVKPVHIENKISTPVSSLPIINVGLGVAF